MLRAIVEVVKTVVLLIGWVVIVMCAITKNR